MNLDSIPNLIKLFDQAIKEAGDNAEACTRITLLINRGTCYQQLGLLRKALKDYDTILAFQENHATALLNSAKVYIALKQVDDAAECLQQLLDAVAPATDLAAVFEAKKISSGLKDGSITSGTKLTVFPSSITLQQRSTPARPSPPATAPAATVSIGVQTDKVVVSSAASPPVQKPSKPTSNGLPSPLSSAPSAPIDSMHSLMAMTDPNAAVGIAVELVNGGKCKEAVDLLNLLLQNYAGNMGAYAARGTAKAMLGELKDAVADFSQAIELEPRYHDFYKRRGQALSALGHHDHALIDMQQAVNLCPEPAIKADALTELAKIHAKRKDHAKAEVAAMAALEIHTTSTSLLSLLASSQLSQGRLEQGATTYMQLLEVDPTDKDAALGAGMAYKEMAKVDQAEKLLRRAIKLGSNDATAFNARKLLAQMLHGLGEHLAAVAEINAGLRLAKSTPQKVEMLLMRGGCYHTVGLHKQAVEDYQAVLESTIEKPDLDTVHHMCLAFYQKELALWARARLHADVTTLCLDADLHPEFKELWCKKSPPAPEFVAMYRNIMQPQHPNWNESKPAPPPSALATSLVNAADALGRLVQYRHQGFLPNRRHHRMAGLAAIEYAQMLRLLASNTRQGIETRVPSAGASVTARINRSGTHILGWRDAMDVIVGWRQLAEPNDQVIWVDLLTEKEFNSGFGSHTPMFTGQTACVRYHMNFDRALQLFKEVVKRQQQVMDADSKLVPLESEAAMAAVMGASSARELWEAIGTDSWVVVPISSSMRSGHIMEGTRLTVVKMKNKNKQMDSNGVDGVADALDAMALSALGVGQANEDDLDAFEFSIRTPVTPARWKDYDQELGGVFSNLISALAANDLPAVSNAAMRFAYYWYNFMPLARGSAFCGYVSLLGTFLAADTPIRAVMPPSYQTDWEAILERSPEAFIASLSSWMLPPEVAGQGGEAPPAPCPAEELPKVKEVLPTLRSRIEALNESKVGQI